ncbi:fam-a protein [Plasmodium chabaudi chabaudi]|uniref:Fam-a protein n=1 Tax=Plasmodium chabaudi chabaudi TaxID=31271 RepID=A0A1C6XHZ4_PLACU|nr:fam-a protein [Plasmodium chabaudi chabaudi]
MNKGYIKVVLFLLSLFVYVTNTALASEQFPSEKPRAIYTSRKVVTRRTITRSIPPNVPGPSNANPNIAIPSNANSNVAGPSNANPNFAGPSHATSNLVGPSNANPNFAGPSHATSNLVGPSNANPNFAGPSHATSNLVGPSNARPNFAGPSHANSNLVGQKNDISNVVGQRTTVPNNYGSDELYEQHKHLLCTDRGEIIRAEKVMKEAVSLLMHHATTESSNDKPYKSKNDKKLNMEKHEGDAYIGKSNHKYPDSDMYTDLVDMLWDPSCSQKPDKTLKNGKVIRVYTPNLILVQYRYKNNNEDFQRYFYALARKHQVSEDTTVIAMTSGNINDHNSADTRIYTNPIVESANLFKTEVNSEPDIRRGELKKMFVNLSGYLIKKESNYVDITYVRSMDGNVPNDSSLPTKKLRA